MRPLEVRRLGRIAYDEATQLQQQLVEQRRANEIPDLLLLLEHPPVITVGARGKSAQANIIASPDRLRELGVATFDAGRGGDVTYHGPGQLVGYPVIDLRPDRCDVHRYVRDLEEVMIRTCGDYGIAAKRVPGLTGAWTAEGKIGAIGVRISRWITSHGFGFNVTTDLTHFDLIVPCGIAGGRVTSLEKLSGRAIPMAEVEDAISRHFGAVFEREVTTVAPARA